MTLQLICSCHRSFNSSSCTSRMRTSLILLHFHFLHLCARFNYLSLTAFGLHLAFKPFWMSCREALKRFMSKLSGRHYVIWKRYLIWSFHQASGSYTFMPWTLPCMAMLAIVSNRWWSKLWQLGWLSCFICTTSLSGSLMRWCIEAVWKM